MAPALASAPAAAQQVIIPSSASSLAHISSSGRGEVRITPDHAIVTAVIDTRSDSAPRAASENTRRYDALMQALRAVGVSAQQVSSPGYTVMSTPEGTAFGFVAMSEMALPMAVTSGNSHAAARPPSTVARRSVRVEPVRLADVDRVVQAALSAGATQVTVQLAAPSLESAQSSAFAAAVADARSNADAMARAAGGTLGRLLDISTSYSPFGGVTSYVSGPFESSSFSGTTGMTVRDVTVVAAVTARWDVTMPTPAGGNPSK
jgi:uncharacterized protein YggE